MHSPFRSTFAVPPANGTILTAPGRKVHYGPVALADGRADDRAAAGALREAECGVDAPEQLRRVVARQQLCDSARDGDDARLSDRPVMERDAEALEQLLAFRGRCARLQ